MADEQAEKGDGLESFLIGAQCEEVGPDLGRLYEARHAATGKAALLLLPGDRVEWRPEEPWCIRLSYQPQLPSLTLRVEEAPTSAQVTELADMLVLMTASVERVEDSARTRAHFAAPLLVPSLHPGWTSRRRAAVAFVLLALGLGLCGQLVRGADHPRASSLALDTVASAPEASSDETWSTEVEASTPQEGLPRPVRNQKRAPCSPGLEVEVSAACWLSITQRPCPRPSIAYEGQCLLPVSAPRPVPASVDGGAPDAP